MTLNYIRQSIFFFKQNIKTLAFINLPFIIISNILLLQFYASTSTTDLAAPSLSMLATPFLQLLMMAIYWGGSIFFMQSTLTEQPMSAGQAINASMRTWIKLLCVFIVTSLAFFFGFMLFIIPGIYLAIRFSIADYICIVENKKPIESLKLSWHRTSGYVGLILNGYAILIISLFILRFILLSIIESVIGDTSLNVIFNILFDFLNIIVMIFGFRLYCLINDECKD